MLIPGCGHDQQLLAGLNILGAVTLPVFQPLTLGRRHLACEHDLEGIVAKRKYDPYRPNLASWLKIRNPHYSQWAGREELFERERESDPDFHHWGVCVEACK